MNRRTLVAAAVAATPVLMPAPTPMIRKVSYCRRSLIALTALERTARIESVREAPCSISSPYLHCLPSPRR